MKMKTVTIVPNS